ncbi:MAG: thiamine phosphate synthase [bacterium]
MNKLPFRYLAISDHNVCPEPIPRRINRLFKLGVPAIQLRDKHISDRRKFNWLKKINTENNTLLINSRADLARLFNLQGVHRAASAISADYIRKISEGNILIGFSTHSLGEIKNASFFQPDYLTFGPIWPTPSKPGLDSFDCAGAEGLEKACRISDIPVFALGGVDVDKISTCLEAGAYGTAGIRALFQPDNPQKNWQKIKKTIKLHAT